MTEMAEHDTLLADRFAALATRDSGDWPDVRRRVRRMQLRRAALVLSVGLVAVAVAAPALGLHRAVVDWFDAEPAGEPTQLEFLQLGVAAPPGMDPRVIPNSAREVTTVQLSSGPTTLAVAPTKSGGFCWRWSRRGPGGSCVTDRTASYPRMAGVNAFALGGGFSSDRGREIPTVVSGRLLGPDIERLMLEYEDGGSSEIPFVWVSAPIDAGFYLYEVPERNRVVGRRAFALVGHDGEGKVVARQEFPFPAPEDVERPARLPDGEMVSLPVNALVEKARKIIDVPSADGKTRMTAWIVPRADGRSCYLYYGGGWCPPAGHEAHPLGAGMGGGNRVVLAGVVSADVARYRLRYQDGAVELVEPVENMIIHEIPLSHYPRGRRLELIQALDADGNVLAQQKVLTDFPGVYPCEKPVDQGHGVMACP